MKCIIFTISNVQSSAQASSWSQSTPSVQSGADVSCSCSRPATDNATHTCAYAQIKHKHRARYTATSTICEQQKRFRAMRNGRHSPQCEHDFERAHVHPHACARLHTTAACTTFAYLKRRRSLDQALAVFAGCESTQIVQRVGDGVPGSHAAMADVTPADAVTTALPRSCRVWPRRHAQVLGRTVHQQCQHRGPRSTSGMLWRRRYGRVD